MKKLIAILILTSTLAFAQTYTVEKLSGKVMVQKGASENLTEIKQGDRLSANDLVITADNASIRLSKDGNGFLLKENSALMPGSIKKMTKNQLLLALAMEDIRNVPKKQNNSGVRSTAVYGAQNNGRQVPKAPSENLGSKKLNGARQLASGGFMESAVVVARETFRKYPDTQKNVPERIYFAGILEKLELYDEASSEYYKINGLNLSGEEKALVKNRLEWLSGKTGKK